MKANFLTHNYYNFTEEHIGIESKYFGIKNKSILERHIWIYELHSHIQKKLDGNCILKGGACAQLYLPLNFQRCTEDLDLYTDLNPIKLKNKMNSLAKDFNISNIQVKIYEYIPKSVRDHGKTMPITTIIMELPLIFRSDKKKRTTGIKIDFLHIDTKSIEKNIIYNGEVLGLRLNYEPVSMPLYSIIASKLLTFGVNTIGVESFKKDKLFKNLYDVYYMIKSNDDMETLKKVGDYIRNNIDLEFYVKGIEKIDLDEILKDILKELYYLSVEDILEEFQGYSKRLIEFEENYIQQNIIDKLCYDKWAVMAGYVYLWVYALREYMINDNCYVIEKMQKVFIEYKLFKNLSINEQEKFIKDKINELKLKRKLMYDFIEDPLRIIILTAIYEK